MLLLEEHWEEHPELQQRAKICFTSSMSDQAVKVFQTYTTCMNENIRDAVMEGRKNPFDFKHIHFEVRARLWRPGRRPRGPGARLLAPARPPARARP